MAQDTFSDITNFFNNSSDNDIIKIGDPNAIEKFYKKLKEHNYNLDELQDILDCEDNMLIVSGAGSGKTTTLLLKILRDILSGKLLKKVIVNGVEYLELRPILVSTFLKSGAAELAIKFDKMCKELNIIGVNSSQISFRTIHSEVYSAITDMGVKLNIVTDQSELNSFLREACKPFKIHSLMSKNTSKGITNEELGDISCILSYARNRLDKDRFNHPLMNEYNIDEITLKAIMERYKQLKALKNVQDFEDLEEILYDGYQKFPRVVNFVKSRYDYIYVDEFQDTSQLQYEILKPYFDSAKGFLCIGDDDQCSWKDLEISTNIDGSKKFVKISDIKVGMEVQTTFGNGNRDIQYSKVDKISKKKVNTDLIVIKTKSGKVLKATENHIGFVKFPPIDDIYFVYLMYRDDLGFRIGQTVGKRRGGKGEERLGIAQRLNREKGDKAWVLRECKTQNEARYWESYYSYYYGIPQYMFKLETSCNYSPVFSEKSLLMLHNALNTKERGMKLLSDFSYDFNYPHFVPKVREDKCALYFTLFGSSLKNIDGVRKSTIAINTTNYDYVKIFKNHLSISEKHTRTGKNYWSCTNTTANIEYQEKKILEIIKACNDYNLPLVVKKQVKIGGQCYDFMPFSNIISGMTVPIVDGDNIIEDTVVDVYRESYNDFVYDISVPKTSLFVGNSTFLHNCIYSWRGSDVELIQKKFELDYKPIVKQLTVNRRCKKNILDAVIPSIEQNTSRHSKKLRASQDGGKVEIIVDGGVNYLTKAIKEDLQSSKKIGILGRTNADLLIPAVLLLIEGYTTFTISKSISLSERIPSQVLGIMTLITQRYNENFESYFKLFLNKYNGYQATKLCEILSTSPEYSIYSLSLDDIRYSAPALFPIIRMLREEVKVDPVKAYASLLEIMEQDVYNGKTIYAQRARDFCYYIRKIILEHESLKNKSIEELSDLFLRYLPKALDSCKPKEIKKKKNENGKWVLDMSTDNSYVKITTVHEAKGKEWDYVYIWNDVDGCFPNSVGNRELTKEEFEEERRVHYIAWTRAVEKLVVFTRSDRANGFLSECDLKDAEIVEMDESKKKVRDLHSFSSKEVFRSKTSSNEIDTKKEVEKKDSWETFVKEYIKKYTNYSYICTPRGSILDACLTKLGGIDGLINYLKPFNLQDYPTVMLEDEISDILESYFNNL